MRKDNRLNKFFNFIHFSITIVALILLALYLKIYISPGENKLFLLFIAPSVLFIFFLSYNCLLVHFHKKGLYTSGQASEFYEKCRDRNISDFKEENFEKVSDIYFSVLGTDKYTGEGTIFTHMAEIYNIGKEIAEKNRG